MVQSQLIMGVSGLVCLGNVILHRLQPFQDIYYTHQVIMGFCMVWCLLVSCLSALSWFLHSGRVSLSLDAALTLIGFFLSCFQTLEIGIFNGGFIYSNDEKNLAGVSSASFVLSNVQIMLMTSATFISLSKGYKRQMDFLQGRRRLHWSLVVGTLSISLASLGIQIAILPGNSSNSMVMVNVHACHGFFFGYLGLSLAMTFLTLTKESVWNSLGAAATGFIFGLVQIVCGMLSFFSSPSLGWWYGSGTVASGFLGAICSLGVLVYFSMKMER
eukprot:maker-scaffold917_size81461-snap-gene-0.11 protein:Tk06072 transcript:maker-scaffold917_size81461-snap-gene-0.11-mRNA-1 annotation:"ferric-chelate reductase 1"